MSYGQVSALTQKHCRNNFVWKPRKGVNDHRKQDEILEQHEIDLQHDPERLSTEFLKSLPNQNQKSNRNE